MRRWALGGLAAGLGTWLAAAGCGAGLDERESAALPEPQSEERSALARSGARTDPGEPKGSGARAEPQVAGPLVIPRPVLDRLVAAGPGALLAQLVLEPERGADKKFLGFRIVSLFGDTPEVLRYGVRPGDLLLSSQGQRIVTPGDLLTVFQRLRGARSVEVQVRRARETLVLQWPVVEVDGRGSRSGPGSGPVVLPEPATAATGH